MKNKLYVVLFAITLCHSAAYSQITITQADIPMVDMLGITASDSSSAIGVGTSGASQTWDFSAYVPTTFDTSYLSATSFTTNTVFPTATFSSCAAATGFSMCSFGYINATGLFLVGVEQIMILGGMTVHNIVSMDPNNQIMSFPFTYTNSRSYSYVQHQISTYTPASPYDSTKSVYHRTVDQSCDGWGTLITPYGTYNALRMVQIQSDIDTSYSHSSGAWSVSGTQALRYDTSYTWFAPGIGTVATISSRAPYRYSFYKQGITSGVASCAFTGAAVYPNPATETLYINNAGIGTKLSLCDAAGRTVYNAVVNSNNYSIDMRACQPGLYLLQITDGSGYRTTHKIAKQ